MPLLRAAGHDVTGTTRSAGKAETLRASGVEPAVVDVFDRNALREAVVRARPEVVIHQLTDLPRVFDPARSGGVLCATPAPHRRHAQSGRRRAGRRLAPVHRPEHRIRLRRRPRAACRERSSGRRRGRWARRVTARGVRALETAGAQHVRHGRHRAALWPALWPRHVVRSGAGRRSMSMLRRTRRCSRSRAASRAFTISPTTTARSRSTRPARSSVSTPAFRPA